MNTYTHETLDIDEAAALMKAQTDTVQQIARRGDLPGAKIGKAWVFMRSDVIAYLRKTIDDETIRRRREYRVAPVAALVVKPQHGRSRPRPVLPSLA